MFRLALLCLPLGLQSLSCYDGQGGFGQDKWNFCLPLSENILMYHGPEGDFLKMGLMIAKHSGWSSLAFGGNGGMKGAQQFVVRKVSGAYVVEERYSTDYVTPELQPTTEAALLFANEESGNIAWGILIPQTSCAAGERYPVEDLSRFMHWALGSTHDFVYHRARGQFHVNLLTGPPAAEDLSSYVNVSFEMPNVAVVMGAGGYDQKNPYICSMFDLSQMLPSGMDINAKHHVAMFSPVLDSTSEKYVHHMILYACSVDDGDSRFTHGQVVPQCESMPSGCNELKWPWAVGSEPVILPNEAGMPMGQGRKWYALQMHYYNPSLDTGVTDSSGVRVTFTNSLRTYDAATFRFNGGTNDEMRAPIPAGVASYTLSQAKVPAACTNTWAVPEVNVLGVVYHAHLVGKSLNIAVMRGGEKVGDLRREKRYDFNHQSLEPASIKKLMKGDELVLSCTYDTSSRTSPTTFGDYTQTEMCWSAFMYYPAQSMNRALYIGNNMMRCQGGGGMQFIMDSVLNEPSCVAKGDFMSTAGQQVLQSFGITDFTTQTASVTATTTDQWPISSASAFAVASIPLIILQAF